MYVNSFKPTEILWEDAMTDHLNLRDGIDEAQRLSSVLKIPQVRCGLQPWWGGSKAHLLTTPYSFS